MDEIYKIEGTELLHLLNALNGVRVLHTLRFAPRRDGFAWKVNEDMWSPTEGTRER